MSNNSNNKRNITNLEKGLRLVREGNLHQADISFETEEKQSIMDYDVYYHHGHLLNRLGQYNGAIDKFDTFLNNNKGDVSCLFGKGISNIGLLKLEKALKLFENVIKESPSHAEAYFYSSIVYCNPFYEKYNPSRAKEYYGKYQDLREEFFKNNPDYYGQLEDDLLLDKIEEYYEIIHNFYNLSDLFIFINQLLESGSVDQFNNFLEDYKKLNFISENSEEQFNIFRLFNDDTPLFDKIGSFNSNKSVEDEFKYVGYDNALIDDLSSKFKGLTIDDKETLIKIMDFCKNSDLSFKDFHDLIRENVLEGNMSIDSFYKKREYIVKSRINENNRKLTRTIEKQLNIEMDNKIEEKTLEIKRSFINELENLHHKYEQLRAEVAGLDGVVLENEQLRADIAILDDAIFEKDQLIIKMSTLMENYIGRSDRKNKLLYSLIIFIIIFFTVIFLYFYYNI